MVKKVTKTKVQKPVSQKPSKPKGKVVSAAAVEDVDTSSLSKKKNNSTPSASTLVEEATVAKALTALKKFIAKKKEEQDASNQLFEDQLIDSIQISFSKKELFTSKKSFKPRLIKIENRPKPEEQPSVCLLMRDNVIDKDLLEEIEASELNELLGEIIPGSELKTTYKQYEKRRQLYSKYDIFLSDDALVTTLPKLLGKTFYESNKVPVPIKIGDKFSIKSVTHHVEKVLSSVMYQLPRSNNLVINLGSVDTVNEDVISQVIAHFEKEDLRAIFLKSNDSPALPLYEKEAPYVAADLEEPETKAVSTEAPADIPAGLPKDIELSQFERGLLELAQDDEIPELLASKIKKSQKKARIEAKKAQGEKPAVKVDEKNKVTKKVSKKGKKSA